MLPILAFNEFTSFPFIFYFFSDRKIVFASFKLSANLNKEPNAYFILIAQLNTV